MARKEGRQVQPLEVSVVICVRNGARTIRTQLDALDRQIEAPPFEVIVVDNGSTDDTANIVTAWVSGDVHVARRVRLVAGPRRPSIPATRNEGARAADGRVIAFCDADDEVDQGWVRAMAEGVAGDILIGGRTHAFAVDGTPHPEVFREGLIATAYLPHVGGNNFSISRQAYFAAGGFDESLPRYGFDDVDFSWRVQEAGFPIGYQPAAIVSFTLSDGTASLRKRIALGRGRVLMAARYPAYDSRRYTLAGTVTDVFRDAASFAGSLVRHRRLDRALAARIAAGIGRVLGVVQYRGGKRVPTPRLVEG